MIGVIDAIFCQGNNGCLMRSFAGIKRTCIYLPTNLIKQAVNYRLIVDVRDPWTTPLGLETRLVGLNTTFRDLAAIPSIKYSSKYL